MLVAGYIILTLKVAVIAVTALLLASLAALARGNVRLHGRMNIVFFALTLTAVLGLELIVRVLAPDMIESYLAEHDARQALRVHLGFALPSALILPFMLVTGLKRMRSLHIALAVLFSVLWIGTFVTGIFFLPDPILTPPPLSPS